MALLFFSFFLFYPPTHPPFLLLLFFPQLQGLARVAHTHRGQALFAFVSAGEFPNAWEYFNVPPTHLPHFLFYDPQSNHRLPSPSLSPLEEGEVRPLSHPPSHPPTPLPLLEGGRGGRRRKKKHLPPTHPPTHPPTPTQISRFVSALLQGTYLPPPLSEKEEEEEEEEEEEGKKKRRKKKATAPPVSAQKPGGVSPVKKLVGNNFLRRVGEEGKDVLVLVTRYDGWVGGWVGG